MRIVRGSMEGEAEGDVESKRFADQEAHRGGIPFGDLHVIEVRRINEVTLGKDASLEAPVEVRARVVGTRELTAGRQLAVIHCELANRFGDCVAAFSFEIEARAEASGPATGLDSATDSAGTPAPDLDCVDNIPV